MPTGKFFLQKKFIVAFIAYFLLGGILLFHYGIQTGGEAEKYIDNAGRLLHGRELRNGFFGTFYALYSLMVAIVTKLSMPLVIVAVLQLILSYVAALSFYKVLVNAFETGGTAFLFFIAYLCCYPIQKWNFFLYSEGIHTSLVVIGVYFFDKLLREKKYGSLLAFGSMLLLVLFSRPSGLLFLGSIAVVSLIWLYKSGKRITLYSLLLLSIATVVGIANSPVTAFVNPDSIRRMEVICQVPDANADTAYREFNRAGLWKAYTTIRDEVGFGKFSVIGMKKLGCFFGMYRPYYSWKNNMLLLMFCIFYPFALFGIFSRPPGSFFYIKMLAVVYLLFTSVTIFITCDDWANRFISPAFPFILILAAFGYSRISKLIKVSGRK